MYKDTLFCLHLILFGVSSVLQNDRMTTLLFAQTTNVTQNSPLKY